MKTAEMFSVGKERGGKSYFMDLICTGCISMKKLTSSLIVPLPWPNVFLFHPFLITPLFNMIASFQ